MVRAERTRKDAHDACRDPVGRCAGRGLGVPGDADDVADARSLAKPVGATAVFRDVDADCMHTPVTGKDPDQQRRVLHANARRSPRRRGLPFVRRGELAAHASLVDARRLRDALPRARPVEPAEERLLGHRCFALELKDEAAAVRALHDGAHARSGEPIDDLHRVELDRPRRGGLRAHALSYRLRQVGGLPPKSAFLNERDLAGVCGASGAAGRLAGQAGRLPKSRPAAPAKPRIRLAQRPAPPGRSPPYRWSAARPSNRTSVTQQARPGDRLQADPAAPDTALIEKRALRARF